MVKTLAELKTDNKDPTHKPHGTYSDITSQPYPEHFSDPFKAGSALERWSPDPSTLPIPRFYQLQQINALLQGSLPDTPSKLKPLQRIISAAEPEFKKYFEHSEDEAITKETAEKQQQPHIVYHVPATDPIISWLNFPTIIEFELIKLQQPTKAMAPKIVENYKEDLFHSNFYGPIEL